jgi:hypothetical protein
MNVSNDQVVFLLIILIPAMIIYGYSDSFQEYVTYRTALYPYGLILGGLGWCTTSYFENKESYDKN